MLAGIECKQAIFRLFYVWINKRGGGNEKKDRQLLVGRVLRCSPFLCMYSIHIHILYIK